MTKRGALTLLAIACFSAVLAAQSLASAQVPAVVKQALRAKFPAVRQVAWKMKADKNYEAEFTVTKAEVAVKFDASGKWLETETAIPASKVPPAVRETIARRFPGHKIIETQDLQRWNDQRLVYEIHLENAKEIVKAQFYDDGTVITQSAKPKPVKGK
jgi:hypothetical protein